MPQSGAPLPAGGVTSQTIESSGGAHVAGDVDTGGGDFVGRDKIIIHHLDPADARNQRNHRAMRQLVRSFWIDGVLKHSLYKEILIRLHIKERPDAVDNRPWDLILQQPGQSDKTIPPGASIIEIFDQVNQLLLILGEPGSGKTTLLLELADALLKRAEVESTHPTPVVFNLSSWAETRAPLAEWLIAELRTKYNTPKKVAQQWIDTDELIPLLDGLDEVQQMHRQACVEAINQFRQEHLTPLAVCSRKAEYEELATRLKLQSAIVLQALSPEQLETFFEQAGAELSTLRSTLHHDPELQDLATSPLMFSIMTMAYYGVPANALTLMHVTETRRQHLFDAYIRRMLAHRAIPALYPIPQMMHWLSWLATQLVRHGQTIFLIERMQPSWAQVSVSRSFAAPLLVLLWGLIYGLGTGLLVGLLNGLLVGLRDGLSALHIMWPFRLLDELRGEGLLVLLLDLFVSLFLVLFNVLDAWLNGLIDGMRDGLRDGIRLGLLVGLLFGLRDALGGKWQEINPIEQPTMLQRRLKNSLYIILSWGIVAGLIFGLLVKLNAGYLFGPYLALMIGLLTGLLSGLLSGFRNVELVKQLSWSWQRIKGNLYLGLLVGLLSGLLGGLFVGLIYARWNFFGMENSFRISGWIYEVYIIVSHWEIHRPSDELLVGLIVCVPVGLLVGLLGGVLDGLIFQSSTAMDIPSKIETQTPNQGIRLSARYFLATGLSIGVFVGLLVELINALMWGVASYFLFSLPYWVIFGLFFGLLFGLVGGGDAVVKHMLLRFVLWKKDAIPWNYARFLDHCTARIFLRKVGGGYIFIHRLLMEHFKDMADEDIERIAGSVS